MMADKVILQIDKLNKWYGVTHANAEDVYKRQGMQSKWDHARIYRRRYLGKSG